jgi:hypothetical protein
MIGQIATTREGGKMHISSDASSKNDAYAPVALYFEAADHVEYVYEDRPSCHVRIDDFLTIIVDLIDQRKVIGFRLKGFKNFYLLQCKASQDFLGVDFIDATSALEKMIETIVRSGQGSDERLRGAYRTAMQLAAEHHVRLSDLPQARNNFEQADQKVVVPV